MVDDDETYLAERGYAGSSSSTAWTNEYASRPWHVPEEFHVTNWTTREMVRLIKRRAPPCWER